MLEHFSFGAQPRIAQDCHQQPSLANISSPQYPAPFSTTQLLPTSSAIGGIVEKMKEQHLNSQERMRSYLHSLPTLPPGDFEVDDKPDDDDDMFPEASTFSLSTSPAILPLSTKAIMQTAGCRRTKRQLSFQLQRSMKHIHEVHILVEHLSGSNTPRTITSYHSPPQSRGLTSHFVEVDPDLDLREASLDIDEGFVDGDHSLGDLLSLRLARAPGGIRKNGVMRWRRSAETANGAKVWQRPRMRRRPEMNAT